MKKEEKQANRPELKWLKEYENYLLYEKSYSVHTLNAYLGDVQQFLGYLIENQISEVNPQVVYAWLNGFFSEGKSQTTKKLNRISQRRKIASLRGFYQFAYKRGFITKNPLRYLKTTKIQKTLPRPVLPLDMSRILEDHTPQNKYIQIRDKALFEFCYSAGLRISEALSLKLDDILINGEIASEIKVLGKGKKERIAFLGRKAQEAIKLYLSIRPFLVGRKDTKALFVNSQGGPLTRVGAAYILRQRKQYLQIYREYTPHSFRHAFATDLLDAGADIRHVQEMLGHKSISTTQRYLAVARERLVNIYRTCHPHAKNSFSDINK